MKKIITVLLILCLALCLAACSKEKKENESSSKKNVSSEETAAQTESGEQTEDAASSTESVSSDESSKNPTSSHKHKYEKDIVKEAKCEEKGIEMYICDCGDNYAKKIPAKGHNWDKWYDESPATTVAPGRMERRCKVCLELETKYYDKLPSTPRPQGPVTEKQLEKIEEAIFKTINAARKEDDWKPFVEIEQLSKWARLRSEELIIQYKCNERPNGKDFSTIMDQKIYNWWSAGEGIGRVTTVGYEDVESAKEAWTGSDEQIQAVADNLLSYCLSETSRQEEIIYCGEMREVGIGVSYVMNENDTPIFYVEILLAAR